jgi:alkanesulfonate monooxygenase SsuD/methylene tetrahydromethanopterin reductase-like flavin-dependent oxidoreductase (luciferase family)
MAPQTTQINQLVALRMGEVWPPCSRALSLPLITSLKAAFASTSSPQTSPAKKRSNETRYARASEIIQILQALWRTDGPFEWKGEFYKSHYPPPNPLSLTSKTAAHLCTSAASHLLRRISAPNTATSSSCGQKPRSALPPPCKAWP